MNAQQHSLRGWAFVGLLAGPFLTMVDSSIVNVGLPAIATSLHSSLQGAQWVASAYLLSLGLTLAIVTGGAARDGPPHSGYGRSLCGDRDVARLGHRAPHDRARLCHRVGHSVQNAEIFEFHDVMGVIGGISLVGFLLAGAIRAPQKERKHHA
ncbi:hypothetical protein [Sulfobacillus harzensis]|uniref:MFS transporter n=1 Tax=Sulfobacillus harzensis TaxID=2729629 RepID=A0A7Y0Q3W7_9FIRM|nr:hypothetical protein [Sulfobacillus harzensis]NMP24708.1 MFS transporter [Sulfobacillus harzensis]